ncbi:unnamed protein product [Oikopleura dioica]|uniref:Cyclic nucleotide-binding domain-containing protein n=1 Tax=Oikopleura dioica TaxID=34765 RepID=E4XN87_OIKDI|nr:unnamed protein product [Oikopleura dioica]
MPLIPERRAGVLKVNIARQRFFRAVRRTIILLRAGGVLKSVKFDSESSEERFSMLLRQKSELTEKMKSSTVELFNPALYKVGNTLNIHSSVRRYLRLPHSLRKSQSLLETSARAIGIFAPISSFNTEIQLEICKCAFLEHFNTGRVLCKENNKAENYYIILQGRALKGKTASLLNGDRLQVTGSVTAGQCIGADDDSLRLNLPRKETVFVQEALDVLTLSRADYMRIFHRKQEISQIQEFLKTIKCLKAFPTERLLDKHVSGTFFRKERLISDSMEMPRNIHFVESGLAKIVKKVVKNVFILVRELRSGEFYIPSGENTNEFLISCGCQVLSIKENDFRKFSNAEVDARLFTCF